MNQYLTEYKNLNKIWCGMNIYANSFDRAESIAESLSAEFGIEIKVVGKLIAVIEL